MGRQKTITDDALLAAARGVFLAHGHTASTRQVADAAGISEAVLYQRFGSKDELFFAALRPPPPDADRLVGPDDPAGEARTDLRRTVVRIGRHFAEAIPLGLRVMSHPAFAPSRLGPTPPGGGPSLRDRQVAAVNTAAAARLLVSLAHDWALSGAMAGLGPTPAREKELREMVDAVWDGLRPG
jgi:AcrR family transcriptional regulator